MSAATVVEASAGIPPRNALTALISRVKTLVRPDPSIPRRRLLSLFAILALAVVFPNARASTVATPTFSPAAGTYTSAQTVTISDSTSGATIYYTTNGSTPTTSSTKYTSAITVSSSETVKAIGTKSGYANSSVGSAAYTINLTVATPTFSPAAGTYTTAQTVTISDSTSGTTIYFTTNGSTPTTSSTQYTAPITVSSSETLKAIGAKSGYTNSSVGSAAYSVNLTTATPTFSPVAGTYTSAQTVTISDSTSGATICYTTNGTTPTTSSPQYTGPITVFATETVEAIATASGYAQSSVGSAGYTINLTTATPAFSPAAGTYTSTQTVTISDSTPSATIYYTTNGITPSTSSPVYSGAITVTSTETVEAIATASGYAQSAVGSATYTIAAPTPVLSPAAGTYGIGNDGDDVNVTITDGNSAATIYYTLTAGTTGTTPTTSSSIYSGPVMINENSTVEAMAVASGVSNSAVATAVYQIEMSTPTMSLVSGTYVGSQSVTLSAGNDSATIYYTTNGTTPTTSSTRYRAAITVSSSETIKAIATLSGYATSLVGSATYTIDSSVPTPTFSPAGGTYGDTQVVQVVDSALNVTVYYTETSGTAGTAPTTSSPVYTGAVSVSSTATIEAMAAVSGYTSSGTATATYTLPAQAASTTTLAITAGGSPVTSVAAGTVVTLTANVASGGAAVTPGTVDFCNASATTCMDSNLIGSAQLTAAGTATVIFRAGRGTLNIKAVFLGTSLFSASSSASSQLQVSGPSTATIGATGGPSGYALTGTVSGTGGDSVGPTGTVSFVDTSNGNATVASASLSGSTSTLAFSESPTIPMPSINQYVPQLLAAGDFNGDGNPDLAVANANDLTVSIELGNGDGTFAAAAQSPIALTCEPLAVAVADFNSDGKEDLAVETGCGVTVLLGNGDGTFNPAPGNPISLDTYNNGLAVGDFNGDGRPDIAVVTWGSTNTATVLLGNGDGTFAQAGGPALTVGSDPDYIVAGDFTGSGKLDLAVGDEISDTITVFLGNGDGTFSEAPGSPISTPDSTVAIATGDFNGDGKADLAAALGYSQVDVLLSNGDGTFAQASGSPITFYGRAPEAIAVGDFNADGKVDLAVGMQTSSPYTGAVVVLPGNGDGSFGTQSSISTGPVGSLAIANFNGTGSPGVAIAELNSLNDEPNDIAIWLSNLTTTTTATASGVIVVGSGAHNVAANYGGDSNYAGSASATTPLTGLADNLTAISPTAGAAGTPFTISGEGFGSTQGSSSVMIGSAVATITSWSPTQIQGAIPNGSGPGPQTVQVVVGGQGGTTVTFTVSPSIATLTPSSGPVSSWVQIAGANFGSYVSGSDLVTFNGVSGWITNWTPSGINVEVPGGAATGPVIVTACNPSASWCGTTNAATFTVPTNPTITGMSPVAGPVGTSVTISGLNFGTSGTVTFNGVAATPTSWGIETIATPVPVGASTGPVIVTAGGTASNSYTFTLSEGVTGIAPTQGAPGTAVTISGTGFGATQGTSTVTFNGTVATVSSWSNTSIVAVAPASGITGSVAVQVNGVSAPGPVFSYQPLISALTPSSGPVGTAVIISGSNFGTSQGTSTVFFGQQVATPTSWSQNTIVAQAPQGATTGPVTVVVGDISSNSSVFTVSGTTTTSTGAISGTVTQSDGVTPVAGASVTVLNGSNPAGSATTSASGTFLIGELSAGTYGIQASAFGFGAASQSGLSVAANQTTVQNLSLAGQSEITYSYDADGRLVGVASPGQGAAAYSYDAVGNILSISPSGAGQVSILSFSPASGPVGTEVTITGSSFSASAQQDTVTIGGTAATVASATTTQLVTTVPAGASTGPISVTSPSGSATSSAVFTVGSPAGAPSITSFSPAIGSPGTSVTITGSGFDVLANDQITFNGDPAIVTSATPTSIVATVPPIALYDTGPIAIATPLGSAVSSTDFYVVPSNLIANVDFTGVITAGGSPYTGTINNGGDIGLVTFGAIAGQQLSVLVSSSTIGSANVALYSPSGAILELTAIGTGNSVLDSVVAPATGNYTILVASN
ncbi:MAG: chitobiase/beta-hexosaminidase C-terminal domain-containing protein [Acidobacteriaceae bacterium]